MASKKLSKMEVNPWVASFIIFGLITTIVLFAALNVEPLQRTCPEDIVAEFPSPSGKESVFLKHSCMKGYSYSSYLELPQSSAVVSGEDNIYFTFGDEEKKMNAVPAVGVQWVDDNTIRVRTEGDVVIEEGSEGGGGEKNIHSIVVFVEKSLLATKKQRESKTTNWDKAEGQYYKGMEEIEVSFNNLKQIKVVKAAKAAGDVELYFDPKISTVLKGKNTDGGKVITTKLNKTEPHEYVVVYDEGPSMDPGFIIYRKDKAGEVKVGGAAGTKIMIPGNGAVYVTGHTNDMVFTRSKYVLKDGKLKYVKQPFKYIGLVAESVAIVKLYESKKYKNVVAVIPKGRKLEVVIRDGDNYLIKSPFGLIGWSHIPMRYQSPISGMYFYGD